MFVHRRVASGIWLWALAAALIGYQPVRAQEKKDSQPKTPEIEVKAPRVVDTLPEAPATGIFGGLFGDYRGRPGTIPWSSGEITSDGTLVGPYNQPAWTTTRPFVGSRSYVLPEGQVELEQWVRWRGRKDEKDTYRFLHELAVGLPGRFQLDIYERWHVEPDDNNHQVAEHEGVQIELRWAFANWGVIPLNPTLYAEWVQRGSHPEPNVYEFRLLLAEQIGSRWFWAANVAFEQETGGERETEWAFSQALSTPLIERKLNVGVEMLLRTSTVHDGRGDPEWQFLIGPGMQWKPTNRTFVNVVPLFGANRDAPHVEFYVNMGFMFGDRAGPGGIGSPISTRAGQ